jgi:hypothetical protein
MPDWLAHAPSSVKSTSRNWAPCTAMQQCISTSGEGEEDGDPHTTGRIPRHIMLMPYTQYKQVPPLPVCVRACGASPARPPAPWPRTARRTPSPPHCRTHTQTHVSSPNPYLVLRGGVGCPLSLPKALGRSDSRQAGDARPQDQHLHHKQHHAVCVSACSDGRSASCVCVCGRHGGTHVGRLDLARRGPVTTPPMATDSMSKQARIYPCRGGTMIDARVTGAWPGGRVSIRSHLPSEEGGEVLGCLDHGAVARDVRLVGGWLDITHR